MVGVLYTGHPRGRAGRGVHLPAKRLLPLCDCRALHDGRRDGPCLPALLGALSLLSAREAESRAGLRNPLCRQRAGVNSLWCH